MNEQTPATADYVAPEPGLDAFNCPHCGAFAHQSWADLVYGDVSRSSTEARISTCRRCRSKVYWIGGRMVEPPGAAAPMPHPDMPEAVKEDYLEARLVAAISPRSACALLRLALQKLCGHLGEPGKNINTDIASLVRKGLPVGVQEALDSLRVVGNNALHPGELDLRDDHETANALFGVMNYIVQQQIEQPKKLRELYEKLPEGARKHIEERDAAAVGSPQPEPPRITNGAGRGDPDQ